MFYYTGFLFLTLVFFVNVKLITAAQRTEGHTNDVTDVNAYGTFPFTFLLYPLKIFKDPTDTRG